MRQGLHTSAVRYVVTYIIAISCAAVMAVPGLAFAQYPEKPVKFMVQWAPSDLEDALIRMIAEDFEEQYSTAATVVIKSEGAGSELNDVAAEFADGYTIGSFVVGVPIAGDGAGIIELTAEQFEPLGIFLTYPFVLVATKKAPFSNIAQLSEYAKNNIITLAHFGAALPPTKAALAYAKNAGFEWGGDDTFDMPDCETLTSGRADVINTTLQHVLPCIDEVNVLASITDSRITQLPDTPTLGEFDATLVIGFWNGLFVHKDTPAYVRQKIIDVAKATVVSERAQKYSADTGTLVYWQDAEQAAQRIRVDRGTLLEIGKILEE